MEHHQKGMYMKLTLTPKERDRLLSLLTYAEVQWDELDDDDFMDSLGDSHKNMKRLVEKLYKYCGTGRKSRADR